MRDVPKRFSSLVLKSQQAPLDIARSLSMCGAWWQKERAGYARGWEGWSSPSWTVMCHPRMVLTMSYTLSLSLRLHTQTHSHSHICTDSHTQTEHLNTQYKVAVMVLS